MEDFVHVPKDLKRYVIGTKGSTVKSIQERSGARVYSLSRDEEGFRVSGTRQERELAKTLILEQVESNKICYFIDNFNLPVNTRLRLEKYHGPPSERQVEYRLRPIHSYGTQESPSITNDPIYLKKLEEDVRLSLERIKSEMKKKRHLKADIWCHFGTILICEPDEGSGGEWSNENALSKLLEGTEWKTSFRGGVNLDEKFLEQHLCNQSLPEYEDYQSRYDLTFRTPNGGQLSFKVWVMKNVGKTLESIKIPFTDLKNILDEVCFEDQFTSSRCHGWLILPPQRYLRADILFPGCEFDCRLTIRALADSGFDLDFVPKENIRHALLKYLSKVTFSDEDDFGLRLPHETLPDGFRLSFMRCSKRAVYRFSEKFSIILSKEHSRLDGSDFKKETDFHLHCKEWDELLKSGNWEPAEITKKLPDFFRFVRKVQSSIIHEMKHEGASVPPEILARGSLAMEAYFKALVDGRTSLKRVPVMLIGQDRAGKTSLKKSLKGICFDPEEDSTVGIEVDPSYFKVTTDAFTTGTVAEQQDAEGDISFDRHAAMKIVHDLRKGNESPSSKIITEETPFNDEYGITDSIQAERHTKHSETREQAPTPTKDVPDISPFTSGDNQEARMDFTRTLPEEIAVETETLLKERDLDDNREHVFLTLWDFAGQSVYYDTHPIFLTEQAIYCLVYDLSLDPRHMAKPLVKQGVYKQIQESVNLKTNLDYLDFWMRSVASLAVGAPESADKTTAEDEMFPQKLPPVFLVCTHADTPYDKKHNPTEIAHEIFGCLKSKPYGIHLSDVFVVDNTKSGTESECPEVVSLREEVYDVAKGLPHISETIPIKWLKFDEALRALKEKGKHFVTLDTAKDVAESCDIVDDAGFETVMNYFHDLRILIHFVDTPALSNLVVLDMQWLIDVFKNVITVKPYHRKEKKFVDLWSKLEKEGVLHEELLSHVWGTLSEKEGLYEGLITIMEKFSLLCLLSSDKPKSYLVPSMLKTRPSSEIVELVSSAQIPSLFVKFKSGKVPAGLFHRFVVQFFRWGKGSFLRPAELQLFQNVVRFISCEDQICSVIFVCHTSTVEVAIYAQDKQKATAYACASVVCQQLGLMLESMRKEFFWLRKMRYEMAVLCPVCSPGGSLVCYCDSHDLEGCKEEHCLHFWSLSELCSAKKPIICTKAGLKKDVVVGVEQFSPWLPPSEKQDPSFPSTSSSASQEGHENRSGQALSRKLKVTLLSSEWQSTKGGLSTLNRELAIQFAKHQNVEVSMYLPQCSDKDVRTAEGYYVKLVQARKSIGCEPIKWLSHAPENHEIDYVIGHGLILGQQAQLIQSNTKCKWVQVVHTAPEDLGMFKGYPNPISRAEEKHKAEIELCESADEVVAVGPKLADAYSRYLRYCHRDTSVFELTPSIFSEFSLVKQAAEERRTFCVLVFGRGDTEDFKLKGYDIAAKAISKLNEECYELLFVGASLGKEEEAVEKLCQYGIARKQLTVRSFKESREELVRLFSEVDLCIMPSRTEGFGLAGLEALSAGLPILVSGNSGLGDALKNVPHGSSCVVNSKDPEEWAKAINIVRKKRRDVRLEETEDLRSQYAKKYCWKQQCDKLVKKMSDSIFGN